MNVRYFGPIETLANSCGDRDSLESRAPGASIRECERIALTPIMNEGFYKATKPIISRFFVLVTSAISIQKHSPVLTGV